MTTNTKEFHKRQHDYYVAMYNDLNRLHRTIEAEMAIIQDRINAYRKKMSDDKDEIP